MDQDETSALAGRKTPWWSSEKLRVGIYVAGVLAVLIAATFLTIELYSISQQRTGADRAYAGYTAALALIAGVAALTALVITIPNFISWIGTQVAQPGIQFIFETAVDTDTTPDVVDGGRTAITVGDDMSFVVKVSVDNTGTAPLLRAIFNIQVASDCGIAALDDPLKQHYTAVMPRRADINDIPEGPQILRYTSAWDDFVPGVPFNFHARVTVPSHGEYQVASTIRGHAPNGKFCNKRGYVVVAVNP